MSDLTDYLNTLKAEDRTLAREYGEMVGPQFQARLGPAVDRVIENIATLTAAIDELTAPKPPKNGFSRLASLRVGDIAKGLVAAVIGGIAILIRQAN